MSTDRLRVGWMDPRGRYWPLSETGTDWTPPEGWRPAYVDSGPAATPSSPNPDVLGDVRAFRRLMDRPDRDVPDVNVPERQCRADLIRDEVGELLDAIEAGDPVAVAHEGIDSIYVVVGAFLDFGLPFGPAWDAIHAANMRKVGTDGKPVLRGDGKVLKPPGWQKADLTPIVFPGGRSA